MVMVATIMVSIDGGKHMANVRHLARMVMVATRTGVRHSVAGLAPSK
jgi:hypothetical protein